MIEEGNETVSVTLLGPRSAGHDYTVGTPSEAELIIVDFVDGIFKDSFEIPGD
jgi:hypothetical protein